MKELGWMQEAGMAPTQIIVAATRNGALACGLETQTGTVQPGKIADLVVVEGDPLTNLGVLAHPQWVIRSGTVIRQQ
jgi:imidazolonepropionase-like amidohydrolase